MKMDNHHKTGMAAVLVITLAVLLLTACSGDTGPAATVAQPEKAPASTATAATTAVTDWYTATGTVRPRTESRIESLVTAQAPRLLLKR